MTIWEKVKRKLTPAETLFDETFSLSDRGAQPAAEQQGEVHLADARIRAEGLLTHIDRLLEAAPEGKDAVTKAGDLSNSLDENVERLKKLFRMPANKDLVIREIRLASQPPANAVVCFMEGLSDKQIQNEHILKPLMLLSHLDHHLGAGGECGETRPSIEVIAQRLLPGNQVSEKHDLAAVAEALLSGDSVVIADGSRTALAIETKSPPARSVGEPKSEKVVWGPHDSFVEAWRVNVALVRKRLKDPRVVTEILTVGEISRTIIGLVYVDGITSPKLVAEVRRRVDGIRVDVLGGGGILEQYIEDNPSSLLPGSLLTERPDRAAAYLSEGHVVLFVDNSPRAVVCPITFWGLLQTAEDYYLRYPFGMFLRYIRLAALVIALVLPAFYIAVINFHQEMVPTELMLFVAASREPVPMPAVVELVIMDLVFELIREAGTRIPSVIGPTVGLVAGLVLGQAAVEAKIVSPLMIIVVAVSGLASFAIPSYLTSFGVRVLRFAMVLSAALLGVYGIAALGFLMVLYLAGMRSFGVPYLAPVAPLQGGARDVLFRPHLFDMEMRPRHVRPLNQRRQPEIVRQWDPSARRDASGEGPEEEDRS